MPYYSLPQLAADKGIKPKTLRCWVGKGILRHSAQTVGGQARYSDADFDDACRRSIGQKDVAVMRPVTVRRGGDVAEYCRKMKKELCGITPRAGRGTNNHAGRGK